MAVIDETDGRHEARLLAEQLRVFFGQTRDAVFGHSLVAAAIVALLYFEPVDQRVLVAWGVLAAAVAVVRLAIYRSFPKEFRDSAQTRRWARKFEVISLVSGGTFGILPVLFLDPSRFEAMAYILLILAGLAGGALGTLSTYSPAFRNYILASVAPLVGVLLFHAQLDLAIIAVLFATMAAYFVRFARRFEFDLVAEIKGRLENVDLAERMTRQRDVLRSVMQSIPDAIAVVDPRGRFVYQNDQFQTLFDIPEPLMANGITSESFNAYRLARGDFDHIDLATYEKQLAHWKRLTGPGEAFGYERKLHDGRVLRIDNHPMADGGWVRSWTDVTEQKLAVEATNRWSELMQLTLDHIDQGLSFIDANGDQVLCNRRFCTLLGLPQEYMSRTVPLRQIIADQQARGDLDGISEEDSSLIDQWERGETPSDRIVYERRQSDGRWLLVSANRLPNGGHVRTFTDITTRKQAELNAADRRVVLEATLASIDQGVIMRDAEDNILVYNERLSELLDIPAEMYAKNTPSEALIDYHIAKESLQDLPAARMADEWNARRRAGLPVERFEYQRPGPNGIWLHVVFQPLPDGRDMRTFTDITAIKAAEEELQEKTRFLEAVLGTMEQGILVTDTEGRISLWNDRACEILGLDQSVMEGRPTADEFGEAQRAIGDLDPDDPSIIDYIDRWKAWMGDPAALGTFTVERRLPQERWMLLAGRKLPEGGTVRTLSEITDRKAAELEAEQARERLRAAMDAMPAGVVIFDEELNYQTWNETYKTMAGLTEDQLATLRSFDEIAELKRDEVVSGRGVDFDTYLTERRRMYQAALPKVTTEYWKSTDQHVELRVNPIPAGGWICVYLDMTDRIRAGLEIEEKNRTVEAALAEAERTRERIGAILQSIPVGVLVYDSDLRVEYWNDAYCAYTGFSREVLADRPGFSDYSQYIFREHNRGKDMNLDAFMAYRERVYRSDESYVMDFFFDKTGLDVQYIVSSLSDGSRVNVMVDITAQKRAERAALDARDTAEEATRAKSAFLAAMSHEIRTPMNAVLGLAEVLEQGPLDDDQRSVTMTIQESGQVLLRIIDDILDFSKIEAGRMEFEPESVLVRSIVESVLDSVGPSAEEKDLDLAVDIDPSTPRAVIADPVRLHQILINLVGNAVKFTNEGFVDVLVSATPDPLSPSMARVLFEVRDSGIGIAADRMDDLFEPFRQAEASTTRRFGGSGLGLSICDRLVTLMGGRIGASSEVGQGSVFWCELPVEVSAAADEARPVDLGIDGLRALVLARPGPVGRSLTAQLKQFGLDALLRDTPEDLPGRDDFDADIVIVDGRLESDVWERALPGYGAPPSGSSTRPIWVCSGRDGSCPPVAMARPVRRDVLVKAIAAVTGRAAPETPGVVEATRELAVEPVVPSIDDALVGGQLVLVVEDNATNRLVVERQLAILGFASESAENGLTGLRMWRDKRYGLVLTDCHMPHMDGYELSAAIRAAEAQDPGRGRTPIVALTANALTGEAERCLEVGMDGYLAKPVTLSEIGAMLGRWLVPATGGAADGEVGSPAEPADSGNDVPIDYDRFEEILGTLDPVIVSRILQVFDRSYRTLVERMRGAIDQRDAAGLREASHAAKGAAGNAAAGDLRAQLERLEKAAASEDWSSVPKIWQEVQLRGDAVIAHIEAEHSALDGSEG